jgi:hypothetical protein
MASNSTDASVPFLKLGKEQTEALLTMQKELLGTYEPCLACSRQIGSGALVRAGQEVVGDPLCS